MEFDYFLVGKLYVYKSCTYNNGGVVEHELELEAMGKIGTSTGLLRTIRGNIEDKNHTHGTGLPSTTGKYFDNFVDTFFPIL